MSHPVAEARRPDPKLDGEVSRMVDGEITVKRREFTR